MRLLQCNVHRTMTQKSIYSSSFSVKFCKRRNLIACTQDLSLLFASWSEKLFKYFCEISQLQWSRMTSICQFLKTRFKNWIEFWTIWKTLKILLETSWTGHFLHKKPSRQILKKIPNILPFRRTAQLSSENLNHTNHQSLLISLSFSNQISAKINHQPRWTIAKIPTRLSFSIKETRRKIMQQKSHLDGAPSNAEWGQGWSFEKM